jgi:inorganic pyrophosphatase
MFLDAIPAGPNPPYEVNVLIEVPLGGEPIKYELDEKAAILVVDRFLYTPMRYRGNYGFILHTLSGDGDPCDVIVANSPAILPGTLMSCKVIGVLLTRDEAGSDEKIVAVPSPPAHRALPEFGKLHRSNRDHGSANRAFFLPLSIFFAIKRISIPENRSKSSAGETPRRQGRSSQTRLQGQSGKNNAAAQQSLLPGVVCQGSRRFERGCSAEARSRFQDLGHSGCGASRPLYHPARLRGERQWTRMSSFKLRTQW